VLVKWYLGQLRLGEARLAHLGGLAHGDVALGQRPLGERLGGPVLAGLAVRSVPLTGALVGRSADPLPPAAARLTLHGSTTLRGEEEISTRVKNNNIGPKFSHRGPSQCRVPAAGTLV